MIERITYDNKLYQVLARVLKTSTSDPTNLRSYYYAADLVLANKEQYWILQEIIDVNFKEI